MSFGLYIHIPFCSALCPYCDFAVVVGRADTHARYCDALLAEARSSAWGARAHSVFVGGGTPTFIDPHLLAQTLTTLFGIVPIEPGAEITIEANPDSVDAGALSTLRAAGANRISIGAQSFDDAVLRALGRTHAAADIERASKAARAAGFDNVGFDLIYGGPGETDESWRESLGSAIALSPEHLSCYALTIEERTPFGTAVARGSMSPPEEDALATRYEFAVDALARAGYRHYELSNWARAGRECAHNVMYWTQGDYLGLGVGAHSHRDGHRWWNTRVLPRYLADPTAARDGEEKLDDAQRAEEWLSLRLRLTEGFEVDVAEERLGRRLDVEGLLTDGLAIRTGAAIRLTARGMLLENQVALRLLG